MKIKKFSEKDIFLFKQLKGGSPEEKRKAQNELVVRYQGLVYKMSNELYQRLKPMMDSTIDRDDLVQEGMLGLTRSLETYDYNKGNFVSYATWSIHSHILRAFQQRASFVAISVNVQEEFRKINRMMNFLRTKLEREPTKKEIAEANRISVEYLEKVIQRVKISREIISLERITGSDRDSELSLHGVVASDVKTPEEIFVEETTSSRLRKKIREIFRMGMLDARERHYLERFFGLEGRDPEKLATIGRKEGLSRERIRQIVKKALDKLRNPGIFKIIKPELSLSFQKIELGPAKSESRFLVILNLLQNTNDSYTEIGKILGTQKEKVERVARKARIDGVSRMRRRRQERMEQNKERVLKKILNNLQMTYKEIGQLLKLHVMTVTKIAWDKGIKRGKGRCPYPKELLVRDKKILAIAQKNANLTHREIGRLFNLSRNQIFRILCKEGFNRSKALKIRNQKISNVIQNRPELSYRRIGRMFNLSHTTIKDIAFQGGIARKAETKK